jgi:predicted SPOUT superfamily RNA methylase MTH1
MPKIEKSTWANNQEPYKNTNLGISSIPKTGRVNQPRDNGIEIGASRSILISSSFPDLERVDILITSQEEILLSRLKMVDQVKDGTSISLQEPLEVDQ